MDKCGTHSCCWAICALLTSPEALGVCASGQLRQALQILFFL